MKDSSTGCAIAATCLLLAIGMPWAGAQSNSVCLDCHDDPESEMLFDTNAFSRSVHGDLNCIDCHDDLAGIKDSHDKVLHVDCAGCHEAEVSAYRLSEHGRAVSNGVDQAASCTDCHGNPHAILAGGNTNSPTHYSHIPKTCGNCHSRPEIMALYAGHRSHVVVDYTNSVHGVALQRDGKHAAVCTDCHGSHGVQKGSDSASPMFWQNIPATCGKCHEEISTMFAASVHGHAAAAGQREAPVCTDCHGEHTIAAIKDASSSVAQAHIPETCGQCHASTRIASRFTLAPGVLETYMNSFHGLASQIGGVGAANCASCHGYHDILPSSDPASSVHRDNLPKTCGKCHQGIGTRLAQGTMRIHEPPGPGSGKPAIVNIIARVYFVLIALIVGGMIIFNGMDYAAKVRTHIREIRLHPHSDLRMTPLVRFQHTLLLITFVVLAYTGFVHKYPDAVWSLPFRVIENGSYWRGLTHRVAGWIFSVLFLLHIVLLVATERGRQYLKHLHPRRHDGLDAWRLLRRNLGLGGPGPEPRRFNFAEKTEYWALVWGSVLMIISGVMLIFTSIVLRLLPEVWLEVAKVVHLYEAVLATLAIVVWHLYWVMFDPQEYPMNPAWMIGLKKPTHAPSTEGEPK